MQFHLEISTEMAHEWAAVPAYAASLERVLGPGATEDFVHGFERRATEMRTHGRELFERWLDAVVEPRLSARR